MIAVTTASPLNTLTIERSLQIFVGTLKTTIFLEWLPEVPVPAQLPWQAVRCLGDQVRDIQPQKEKTAKKSDHKKDKKLSSSKTSKMMPFLCCKDRIYSIWLKLEFTVYDSN